MGEKFFTEKLTPYLKQLIQKTDSSSVLQKQFLYDEREESFFIDESPDPLGEDKFSPYPFLIHKFPKRVLLLLTGECFSHCRFCFRRWRKDFLVPDLEKIVFSIIEYLKTKSRQIEELIFSGGDPLSLSNKKLSFFLETIEREFQEHFIFRFHTRAPVVFPKRVDREFLNICERYFPRVYLVIHINTPQEITGDFIKIATELQKVGVHLLSQTVLLQNVNDSVETLEKLFLTLYKWGIKPYYLHSLDRVPGNSHFFVPHSRGKKLISRLRQLLPGPAVPLYVQDGPDVPYKFPLS